MLENKYTNVSGAGAQNCALLQSAASVAAVIGLYSRAVASVQLVPAPWVALHHLMKLMTGEFSTNKKPYSFIQSVVSLQNSLPQQVDRVFLKDLD